MAKGAQPSTSTLPATTKRPAIINQEIDDIFALKKRKPNNEGTGAGEATKAEAETAVKKTKKSKKEKGKGKDKAVEEVEAEVETVVDSSAKLEAAVAAPQVNKKRARGAVADEEELFMDSRGTARRRTDDGLAIYDIAELKIGLGGDTELCPFDCECCF